MSIFTEQVLVVNQKAKIIEINNEYAIFDAQGTQIGAVRQVGQSKSRKVLRALTSFDQFLTTKLDVVDADGTLLLALVRPAKFIKSKVIVSDGRGKEIGRIVQENMIGKIRFALQSNGQTIGSINAENWRAWNFNIQNSKGKEVARINKTWEGFAKTLFTTADNYKVEIHEATRGPAAQPRRRRRAERRHRPKAGLPRPQLVARFRTG